VDEPTGSLRGHLLVATPPLVDPNFDRSVVLMLEHGEDGALGIVLNRPSETNLDDVLPEWHAYASAPAVVFAGGPVAPDAVIALARGTLDPDEAGLVPIIDDLGTVDLGRDPDDLTGTLDYLRVFVGYAGWAPGQLESELERNAWFVVDLLRDDPFVTAPSRMWHDVLRRQRGPVAMFAHFPDDATAN
jgi:putative transcriptional regulator